MHEDENLKELILKGGIEKASPAFTNNVMKRIERHKYIHAPLLSAKWIGIFRITFVAVIGLLVLVGLFIKISFLGFDVNLKLPETYFQHSDTVIIYIMSFWVLIFVGQRLNSKTKGHH